MPLGAFRGAGVGLCLASATLHLWASKSRFLALSDLAKVLPKTEGGTGSSLQTWRAGWVGFSLWGPLGFSGRPRHQQANQAAGGQ